MWEELRYQWALRKYLKGYALTRETHASVKDFSRAEGEPDLRQAMEKEQTIQEHEIGVLEIEVSNETSLLERHSSSR